MAGILDDILDFFNGLQTWQKWSGLGIIGVLLFFILLLILAGPDETKQVVGIPGQLRQIEQNLTTGYIRESKKPASNIIQTFHKTGDNVAKQVGDPVSANSIRFLWLLSGVLFASLIVLVPVLAIRKAFKRIL